VKAVHTEIAPVDARRSRLSISAVSYVLRTETGVSIKVRHCLRAAAGFLRVFHPPGSLGFCANTLKLWLENRTPDKLPEQAERFDRNSSPRPSITFHDTLGFRVSPQRDGLPQKVNATLLCSLGTLLVDGNHQIRGRQLKTGQYYHVVSSFHSDCPLRSLLSMESALSS
jgi:hypothetical protein